MCAPHVALECPLEASYCTPPLEAPNAHMWHFSARLKRAAPGNIPVLTNTCLQTCRDFGKKSPRESPGSNRCCFEPGHPKEDQACQATSPSSQAAQTKLTWLWHSKLGLHASRSYASTKRRRNSPSDNGTTLKCTAMNTPCRALGLATKDTKGLPPPMGHKPRSLVAQMSGGQTP